MQLGLTPLVELRYLLNSSAYNFVRALPIFFPFPDWDEKGGWSTFLRSSERNLRRVRVQSAHQKGNPDGGPANIFYVNANIARTSTGAAEAYATPSTLVADSSVAMHSQC